MSAKTTGKNGSQRLEMRRVDELKVYARNGKKHGLKQVGAICESIRQFGFRFPIAIDPKNVILAGHGRLEAAKQLGLSEVPVIVHEGLTDEQARALRIADNALANKGQMDTVALREELNELLGAAEVDLDAIGIRVPRELVEPDVEAVDTSDLMDRFWITVRGPMPKEPETLEAFADRFRDVEGVEIVVGYLK